MTATEFKRKLKQIEKHYDRIGEIINSLPEGLQIEMHQYHNEEGSAQHCYRWGSAGIMELRSDSLKIYKKAKENYNI